MKVNISDLRKISDQLFAHLEASGHSIIDIPVDYYWDIPKETRYSPYKQPEVLNLGQITDDWLELQKIKDASTDPIAYGLVWMSSILRVIGEQIVG